jgi:hypothetical protein
MHSAKIDIPEDEIAGGMGKGKKMRAIFLSENLNEEEP